LVGLHGAVGIEKEYVNGTVVTSAPAVDMSS
jgi:hypothetical protein